MRPFERDFAYGVGKSPVFRGVGRQLMQHYGDRLSGIGLQENARSLYQHSSLMDFGIGCYFLCGDCRQLGAVPARRDKKRANIRERSDATNDCEFEIFWGVCSSKIDRRQYVRK